MAASRHSTAAAATEEAGDATGDGSGHSEDSSERSSTGSGSDAAHTGHVIGSGATKVTAGTRAARRSTRAPSSEVAGQEGPHAFVWDTRGRVFSFGTCHKGILGQCVVQLLASFIA